MRERRCRLTGIYESPTIILELAGNSVVAHAGKGIRSEPHDEPFEGAEICASARSLASMR